MKNNNKTIDARPVFDLLFLIYFFNCSFYPGPASSFNYSVAVAGQDPEWAEETLPQLRLQNLQPPLLLLQNSISERQLLLVA